MELKFSNVVTPGTCCGTTENPVMAFSTDGNPCCDPNGGAGFFALHTADTATIQHLGEGTLANPLRSNVRISQAANQAIMELGDGIWSPMFFENGLIQGGGVTWVSGYTFDVAAALYRIANQEYTYAGGQVTLGAADPDEDRFDTLALDVNGNLVVIPGTPSNDPSIPTVDPQTQVFLTAILVSAATLEPGIAQDWIYRENVEWTTTANSPRLVANSANSPYNGLLNIEATNALNGDSIQFDAPGPFDITDYNVLTFKIDSKAGWQSIQNLQFRWYNTATPLGNTISLSHGAYAFNSSLVGVDQTIVINLSSFGAIAGANRLLMTVSTIPSRPTGFFIDEIQVQDVAAVNPAAMFFMQNGNQFGETARLGTRDAFDLDFLVGDVRRARLRTSGVFEEFGNQLMSGTDPAISFFLGTQAAGDYYIQRSGTTLNVSSAGVLQENIANVPSYSMVTSAGTGHRWFSATSPTNNTLMQLFSSGSLAIQTTSSTITESASAILDVTSTTRGALLPRMTTTQRNAISSPATSLLVYNTTLTGFQFYNGSAWQNLITGANGLIASTTNASQVRWGGTALDVNSSIPTSAFNMTMNSSNSSAVMIFNSTGGFGAAGLTSAASSLATGLYGENTGGGVGVKGVAANHYSVEGIGKWGGHFSNETSITTAGNGMSLFLENRGTTSNNAVTRQLVMFAGRGNLAAGPSVGHGTGILIQGPFSSSTSGVYATIDTYLTDTTEGNTKTAVKIGRVGGSPFQYLLLDGDASLHMTSYGDGLFEDTPTWIAGWDANGKFVEIDPDSLGGGGGPTPGIDTVLAEGEDLTAARFIEVGSHVFYILTDNSGQFEFNQGAAMFSSVGTVTTFGVQNTGFGLAGIYIGANEIEDGTWPILHIQRTVIDGTAAPGVGAEITFSIMDATSAVNDAVRLHAILTDVTALNRTAAFKIQLAVDAVMGYVFEVHGSGQARLNNYGSGTITGTPAYLAGFDASGNIIELGLGGGSGVVETITSPLGSIDIDDSDPANVEIDISPTYSGQTTITSLGSVTVGTWNATTISTTRGGTGQTTYSSGQILIGTAAGGLAKTTLTDGVGIFITEGDGSITIATFNHNFQTSSSSSYTWNVTNGEQLKWTISGSSNALTISNAVAGRYYMLQVIQANGGDLVDTWPAGTIWFGGIEPVLSDAVGESDFVMFLYDGANFYAQRNPLEGSITSLLGGGTGSALTDPGADRVMFWDDSAGEVTWLTMGTNLSISGTTLNASGGGGGANPALDNLASVAINTTLVSDTNNTDDLGTTSIAWKDVHHYTSKMRGATSGTITLIPAAVAGTNTITLPASTGTVSLTSDQAVTKGFMTDTLTINGVSTVIPRYTWWDDFAGTTTNSSGLAFLGELATGTGSNASISTAASSISGATGYGYAMIETGTTTTGRGALSTINLTNANTMGKVDNDYYYRLSFKGVILNDLSDGTDTYSLTIGFGVDNANTNGIWFTYTHGTNSGNWVCTSYNNATPQTTNTSTAVAADTEFNLDIEFYNQVAKFWINGSLEATHSTQVPAAASAMYGVIIKLLKSAGTTNRQLFIDAVGLRVEHENTV